MYTKRNSFNRFLSWAWSSYDHNEIVRSQVRELYRSSITRAAFMDMQVRRGLVMSQPWALRHGKLRTCCKHAPA
jgi:hypothetical protein